MPRNRVIYNSEALFAGQKVGEACYQEDEGVNSIKQLHRVQSANYNFNIARTDINQYGELAAVDRIITDTPTVALDFSYYLSNFFWLEVSLNILHNISSAFAHIKYKLCNIIHIMLHYSYL